MVLFIRVLLPTYIYIHPRKIFSAEKLYFPSRLFLFTLRPAIDDIREADRPALGVVNYYRLSIYLLCIV